MRIIIPCVLAALATLASPSWAADRSQPHADPVVEPATLRCLGVYWVIDGDANQNAHIELAYRKAAGAAAPASTEWLPGPPLFRVAKGANKDQNIKVPADGWLFAGSIIDVPEATDYDLRVRLIDPDGGDTEKILHARTIAEPVAPLNGPTHHVIPGDGGGSGTREDPFKGLSAAEKTAKAGDTFLLHAGTYSGRWTVRKSGEEGHPIVWRGAGDGDAIIQCDVPVGPEGYPPGHVIEAVAKHDVWFEALSIRGQEYSGLCMHESYRMVVRRCKFDSFLYGICAERNTSKKMGRFFIADNTLHGHQAWPVTSEQWGHHAENRGIWVGGVANVICYNRIDHFKDGIDTLDGPTAEYAVDIHNNDVSDCYDDGSEMDGSHRNCRNFLNRYVNTLSGISFQPVYGGPIYAYRNVIYNTRSEFLKLHNSPSGAVIVHNTFVHNGPLFHISTSDEATNCYMRNNLFVGTKGPAVDLSVPMKEMDFDYDGFAGLGLDQPFFLRYNKAKYAAPQDVRAKAPIEKHVIVIDPANLFASGIKAPDLAPEYDPNAPGYSWTTGLNVYKPETIDLRLNPKSGASGTAQPLPGFNAGSESHHADLGAYPVGSDLPHYGPRPEKK